MPAYVKKTVKPNPLTRATFLSRAFFWWLKDIIWYGRKHDIVPEDLYDVNPKDLSEPLAYNLESNWIEELTDARKKKKKPSLWKVVLRTYGWDLIKLSIFPTCYTALQMFLPELLRIIILYFQPMSTISTQRVYLIATTFIFVVTLHRVFYNQSNFHLGRLGMQARVACASLIYKKLTRLSPSAKQKWDRSVISLLSVDVNKFSCLFIYMPFIVIIPIRLIIVSVLISQYVGVTAAAIGIVVLILQWLPLQAVYSTLTLKYRAKQATRTDYRISLIAEIIREIQAVKMYVWEKYLEKLVFIARDLEVKNYFKISYLTSVMSTLASMSHRICMFAITLTNLLQNSIITTDKIIPVSQHLFNLRTGICFYFFHGLRLTIDMSVSMKRIEEFLLLEEVKISVKDTKESTNKMVLIKQVTACWDEKLCLFEEVSLDFAEKKLYTVVGSVGSGKSSLLQLILGELPTVSGEVVVRGKVSYASQEPWLFNGSVRDNILFGETYDEEKYDKTINACALVEDFRQFPYRDKTLVGERGSNLSGGQRARVNLARAVYREADIYLFDDPLSAVDTLVAKHIMKDCIHGLLRDKTRILITHDIQHLNELSEIILLEHGKVEFRGNIEDFRRNDQCLSRLLTNEIELSKENETSFSIDKAMSIEKPTSDNSRQEPKETEELIAKGAMKSSVYMSYIRAGGWNWLSAIILTNVLFVITVSLFDFGLVTWGKDKTIVSKNITDKIATINVKDIHNFTFLYILNKHALIFGILITIIILSSILKSVVLSKFAFNATKIIHNDILSRLMSTTLRFFEANSTGKILNRFSEDTGVMDSDLPQALNATVNPTFHIIAMLLSTLIANWWLAIPLSIFTLIISLISKIYARSIQKIKRLSGTAKSPILSFAASSLEGVITIRACSAEHIAIKNFNTFQDQCTAAEFITVALPQAFCLWSELIICGFLASITYLFIFMISDKSHDSYVGLTIVQILFASELMSYQVTQVADASAHMTSVERMLQFKELEQESLIEDEPIIETPPFWPCKGEIVFEHLYLKYSDDSEPVLWDLNCQIESKSKVGIVGRTGAGKSSIISALFRFAKVDGSIFIDGLDIKRINLYELRSKISVIPQNPLLFKTTLRKNLDPLDRFEDSILYLALESVELKSAFNSLDVPIERGGSNLSVGQRQLLCLARAIVNKSKILILDEATANVDSSTDAIIQKTIRSEFKESTVLTIAHRLNTVMDSDKILVMDGGRLIEYDHPFVLLQNKDGHLFKMVEQGGEATLNNFIDIAKNSYNNLERLRKI